MRVKWIRTSHRWLGLLIGIQLLFWTVSGLYFSWNPITEVRGEHLTTEPPALALDQGPLVAPSTVLSNLRREADEIQRVAHMEVRPLLGAVVYEVVYETPDGTQHVLIDARSGTRRPELTEDEAVQLAQSDFAPDAPVMSVERVEEAAPGSEYRGVTLPAYRVVFDHPTNTRLYISAPRGRVMARRNDTWRWFDFMWMFHIMDYDARDDFNHWLLQAVSVLGVVTVLSGFLLGAVTSPWLRGRRRKKRATPQKPASAGTRPVQISELRQQRD